jgi:hypothetical protein
MWMLISIFSGCLTRLHFLIDCEIYFQSIWVLGVHSLNIFNCSHVSVIKTNLFLELFIQL